MRTFLSICCNANVAIMIATGVRTGRRIHHGRLTSTPTGVFVEDCHDGPSRASTTGMIRQVGVVSENGSA
jgi:hypothetical protein